MLQTEYKARPTDETGRRLHDFTSAILGIFNGMNNAMLSQQFELNNDIAFSVRAFLERFDAVFTLNQDALLEAQYIPQAGSRWSGKEMPGTKSFGPASLAKISAVFQAARLSKLDSGFRRAGRYSSLEVRRLKLYSFTRSSCGIMQSLRVISLGPTLDG
jgi:hypothetical protein